MSSIAELKKELELVTEHLRIAKENLEYVKEENEKLKQEKDVLMAVAAGNWKRGDEFKEICQEYFTEEYIQSCVGDKGSALVGEYFQDTEEEDNRMVEKLLAMYKENNIPVISQQ